MHEPAETTRKPFAQCAIAALGSLTALLLISISIGGFDRLPIIIREGYGYFLLIAVIAATTGQPLGKFGSLWTFAGGSLIGFLGGFLILLYAVSNI